jgi:hypothetical protein
LKYTLDISKAVSKGFKPKFSIEEGIKDFIEMYKKDWKIPLFKTYSDESDISAVANVIRRGYSWANGPEVKNFEKNCFFCWFKICSKF